MQRLHRIQHRPNLPKVRRTMLDGNTIQPGTNHIPRPHAVFHFLPFLIPAQRRGRRTQHQRQEIDLRRTRMKRDLLGVVLIRR